MPANPDADKPALADPSKTSKAKRTLVFSARNTAATQSSSA